MDDLDAGIIPIGKALGKAYNSEINFFTHCFLRVNNKTKKYTNNYVQSILCLSTQEIIFFKDNFKKPIFRFGFEKINFLTIERNIKYNLTIHLQGVVQKLKNNILIEIPYIYLMIPERNYFIENLMCCYTVFNILTTGNLKNLKIKSVEQVNFEETKECFRLQYKKLYNNPPTDYYTAIRQNYCGFFPEEGKSRIKPLIQISDTASLASTKTYLENNKDKKNYNISNNNSEYHSSDTNKELCNLGNMKDLEITEISKNSDFLSFNSGNLTLHTYNQLKVYFSEKIKLHKLVILKETPYVRKYNLSNDLSKWEARKIECFDYEDFIKITFIILRRTFIPPFCDNYQETIFLREEKIVINNRNFALFDDDLEQFLYEENFEGNKKFEMLINSFHNFDTASCIFYKDILNYLFECLCLDVDGYFYFINNIGIKHNEMFLMGLKLVYFIGEIIKKHSESFDFQKLNHDSRKQEKIEILLDEIEDYLEFIKMEYNKVFSYVNKQDMNETNKNTLEHFDGLSFKVILEKFKSYIDDPYLKIESTENFDTSEQWNIKVMKFLYFCLDGGIIPGFIDIGTLLLLMKISEDFCRDFRQIYICLLVFNDNINNDNFNLYTLSSSNKNLIFNHNFLIEIIKQEALDEVFDSSIGDKKQSFSFDFILFFLKNYKSYEVLESLESYLSRLLAFSNYQDRIFAQYRADAKIKLENIAKLKIPIAVEILEIFKMETLSPHVIYICAKILYDLVILETENLKLIKILIEKNFLDFLILKLNINYLPLINCLLYILSRISYKFTEYDIKNTFLIHAGNFIKTANKLIEINFPLQNQISISKIIKICRNFFYNNKKPTDMEFYELMIQSNVNQTYSITNNMNNKFFIPKFKNVSNNINPYSINRNNSNNKISCTRKNSNLAVNGINYNNPSLSINPNINFIKLKLNEKEIQIINPYLVNYDHSNNSFLRNLLEKILLASYDSIFFKVDMIKRFKLDKKIFLFFNELIRYGKPLNSDDKLFYEKPHNFNFLLYFYYNHKFDEIFSLFNKISFAFDKDEGSIKSQKTNKTNEYQKDNASIFNREELAFLELLHAMFGFLDKLFWNIIKINDRKYGKIEGEENEADKNDQNENSFMSNDLQTNNQEENIVNKRLKNFDKIKNILQNLLDPLIMNLYEMCDKIRYKFLTKGSHEICQLIGELKEKANTIRNHLKND